MDLVEELIYHSIKSGDSESALTLYEQYLGGYETIAWQYADYQRGLRISLLFDGQPALKEKFFFRTMRSGCPWYDECLLLLDVGDLPAAETKMRDLLKEVERRIGSNDSASSILLIFV
jgi:hypothetical protein